MAGRPTFVTIFGCGGKVTGNGVCSALVALPAPAASGNLSETRRTHRVRPLTSPLRTETPTQNTHNPTKISLAPAHTPTVLPSTRTLAPTCTALLQHLLPDPISLLRSPAPTRRYISENTPTTSHTHFTTLLHESLPLSFSPAASSSHTGANLNESWHDSRQ